MRLVKVKEYLNRIELTFQNNSQITIYDAVVFGDSFTVLREV